MSVYQVLTIAEIREYVSDYTVNNYLIDGEEFTDTYINLCMGLAVDIYNITPPRSYSDNTNFPSKNLLLQGTLWKMYEGKATLLARNTMSYSDGGLQIPIEERAELYKGLANGFKQNWDEQTRVLKTHLNMEAGWGHVSSDQAHFPLW